jgi:dipeptidyl aminopeptidase/acylaminoacyl peptidase
VISHQTYIVHGDADRYVGVEQAREVADSLKEAGVDYQYDEIKGADHMFDNAETVKLEPLYGFLKARL